jgi:hypothetical protein
MMVPPLAAFCVGKASEVCQSRSLGMEISRGVAFKRATEIKMKIWKVITNTGKQADLESGIEKKAVQKPTHISAREFAHWLAAESHIDDDSLRTLFQR